jgi:hypothetical protein
MTSAALGASTGSAVASAASKGLAQYRADRADALAALK